MSNKERDDIVIELNGERFRRVWEDPPKDGEVISCAPCCFHTSSECTADHELFYGCGCGPFHWVREDKQDG